MSCRVLPLLIPLQTCVCLASANNQRDLDELYKEIAKQNSVVERLSDQLCDKELALFEVSQAHILNQFGTV